VAIVSPIKTKFFLAFCSRLLPEPQSVQPVSDAFLFMDAAAMEKFRADSVAGRLWLQVQAALNGNLFWETG